MYYMYFYLFDLFLWMLVQWTTDMCLFHISKKKKKIYIYIYIYIYIFFFFGGGGWRYTLTPYSPANLAAHLCIDHNERFQVTNIFFLPGDLLMLPSLSQELLVADWSAVQRPQPLIGTDWCGRSAQMTYAAWHWCQTPWVTVCLAGHTWQRNDWKWNTWTSIPRYLLTYHALKWHMLLESFRYFLQKQLYEKAQLNLEKKLLTLWCFWRIRGFLQKSQALTSADLTALHCKAYSSTWATQTRE